MKKTWKSEDRVQQEVVNYFWNTFPKYRKMLFSVPNGGVRSSREAKLFKLTGLTPGVSDLILLYNGTAYLIETKREDGKGYQFQAQIEWQAIVESFGFNYFLYKNLDEFKNIIHNIIKVV